ncbi:hypothetical protein Goshw_025469 [Gossypium schwendimanii]|uniref:Uncharacterized protein n=1 Tax=Gossypium schwendimanii TaxID=34291 RepID=A0A7J9L5I5_GOSSC|nr:hypothetical protein [Gossypium schwendimanii]
MILQADVSMLSVNCMWDCCRGYL